MSTKVSKVSKNVEKVEPKKRTTKIQKFDECIKYILENKDSSVEELTKKVSKMVPAGSSYKPEKVKKETNVKRATNAYFFFAAETRANSKEKLKNDVIKEKWDELTEKKKAKFVKMAAEDKERYRVEKEAEDKKNAKKAKKEEPKSKKSKKKVEEVEEEEEEEEVEEEEAEEEEVEEEEVEEEEEEVEEAEDDE